MVKYRYILSAFMVASLFSCMEDLDDQMQMKPNESPIFTSVMSEVSAEWEGVTRVVDNKWKATNQVGIHMAQTSLGTLPDDAEFKTYQPAAAATGSATLTPTAADQTFYYPNGFPQTFYAFSPYQAPTNNTVTYSATSQNSDARIEAVDFIWAKSDGTHGVIKPNVELPFEHKACKIVVNCTIGDAPGKELTYADLKVKGLSPGATYNLSDGSVASLAKVADIDVGKIYSSSKTQATFEFIVPPQTHEAGEVYFDIRYSGGGTITKHKLSNVDYKAGKVYTYNLTLNYEDANCYTLRTWWSTVDIPVKRAYTCNTYMPELTPFPAGATPTVEVVWTDHDGILDKVTLVGTGPSAMIHVESSTGEGNAVIALKSGSTIYWTWHIWVTDREFHNEKGHLMDCLLGDNGDTSPTIYQWGRPQPFPGINRLFEGDTPKIYDKDGNILPPPTLLDITKYNNRNIQDFFKYPLRAYVNKDLEQRDIIKGGTPEKLRERWQRPDGSKSILDPCPSGWMLPTTADLRKYEYDKTSKEIMWQGHSVSNINYRTPSWEAIENLTYILSDESIESMLHLSDGCEYAWYNEKTQDVHRDSQSPVWYKDSGWGLHANALVEFGAVRCVKK